MTLFKGIRQSSDDECKGFYKKIIIINSYKEDTHTHIAHTRLGPITAQIVRHRLHYRLIKAC